MARTTRPLQQKSTTTAKRSFDPSSPPSADYRENAAACPSISIAFEWPNSWRRRPHRRRRWTPPPPPPAKYWSSFLRKDRAVILFLLGADLLSLALPSATVTDRFTRPFHSQRSWRSWKILIDPSLSLDPNFESSQREKISENHQKSQKDSENPPKSNRSWLILHPLPPR